MYGNTANFPFVSSSQISWISLTQDLPLR